MRRILFPQLTIPELRSLASFTERGLHPQPWEDLAKGDLSEEERRQVAYVSQGLRRFQPSLVNEATVFGRAILPLLLLAEAEGVQAMADVSLEARFGEVELAGSADAALGRAVAGELVAPFLVLVEAKRGVEGSHPVPQLYGEMLAAACLNAQESGRPSQTIYGCYTVADSWTFVQMLAESLDTPHPGIRVTSSPEISEKTEAVVIATILKSIVAEHRRTAG
jgi:hypothetical protein